MKKMFFLLLLIPALCWAGSSNSVNISFVDNSGICDLYEAAGSAFSTGDAVGYDATKVGLAGKRTIQDSGSHNTSRVDLHIYRVGTPATTFVCKIYSDNAGTIDTLLGTSTAVDCSSISDDSANPSITPFIFTTSVTLTASTAYWISVELSNTANHSTSNYIRWGKVSGGASAVLTTTEWGTYGTNLYRFDLYEGEGCSE